MSPFATLALVGGVGSVLHKPWGRWTTIVHATLWLPGGMALVGGVMLGRDVWSNPNLGLFAPLMFAASAVVLTPITILLVYLSSSVRDATRAARPRGLVPSARRSAPLA